MALLALAATIVGIKRCLEVGIMLGAIRLVFSFAVLLGTRLLLKRPPA